MSQIMEADMLASGGFQTEMEPTQHRAGSQRHVFFYWRWEHPAGVYRCLVFPQYFHHRRGENDLADGVLCLRLADLQLSPHSGDLPAHIQNARLKIKIIPLEPHDLAPSQTCGQIQEEELVVALGLCLDEKPLELLTVQYLHLPCLLGRKLTADGRVGAYEPLLHRFLQSSAADGVVHSYHPVGQALAVALNESLSATLFQSPVELLEVILSQLIQWDVADLRDDMQADAVFVTGLGGWTNLWLGVVFIPVTLLPSQNSIAAHVARANLGINSPKSNGSP